MISAIGSSPGFWTCITRACGGPRSARHLFGLDTPMNRSFTGPQSLTETPRALLVPLPRILRRFGPILHCHGTRGTSHKCSAGRVQAGEVGRHTIAREMRGGLSIWTAACSSSTLKSRLARTLNVAIRSATLVVSESRIESRTLSTGPQYDNAPKLRGQHSPKGTLKGPVPVGTA